MLLRKQSTWSGQTKEHVCVKSTPYHGSAAPPGEGPARARCRFSLQLEHPASSQEAAGVGERPRAGARVSGSLHHRPGNSSDRAWPDRSFPQAAKISFHLQQAAWGLAGKRSVSRDAVRGRGPGTVYSCQNVSDGRLRHICSSLSPAVGHAGSASNLSLYWRAVIALGLVISCALLISPEDGSHPARGWRRAREKTCA